jgi:tricarballylate dehydrogenase
MYQVGGGMRCYDVAIVGAGNLAFCAAPAARERVERVIVSEKAPREWSGGDTYFAVGVFRTTCRAMEELRSLLDDVSEELLARTGVPPYIRDDLLADPAEADLT